MFAGPALGEVSNLDATICAYREDGERLPVVGGTKDKPARGPAFFGFCDRAMHEGWEITFLIEGPDAEEAAGRVRRLLDKPAVPGEIERLTREWAFGSGKGPAGGYERAELRAKLPGEHGLECIFYQYLAHRTQHLRKEVYVAYVVDGEEFRPALSAEHTPVSELAGYQLAAGGVEAYGKGRPLEVTFVAYSPAGSSAASEAVSSIAAALEDLRPVAQKTERERTWFAARYGLRGVGAAMGGAAYRPPRGVLSNRPAAPTPEPPELPAPDGGFLDPFREQIRGHLERWGALEDYDRMKADLFKPAPRPRSAPEASAPWTPPPEPEWLTRHREFEEQQKAMNAKYGRIGGGS